MKLYNTLTKSLETFKPNDSKHVKMYVCGITPYDTTHLGHAFTYMTFDILQRYLKYLGYQLTYVQNVTDIDDDILKKARAVKQDWKELGNFWTERFLEDLKQLRIQMPHHYVKATETIPTIIEIIQGLQKRGLVYENGGNVYFRVQKVNEYGKLSKYSEAEMIKLSGERGADPEDKRKEHPLDFILWQKSLPDEPYWESPYGKGRPGWHIECSAIIYKFLGNNIDIHGGGSDLIYPHHESEIAQSESFTGSIPFSKFWIHTGAVGYQGKKMSKSLGNLVMISDLLKNYSPNTIRYLLLSHHYREPWEYKEAMIEEANKKVEIISKVLKAHTLGGDEKDPKPLHTAMQNDLNTPEVLKLLEQTILQKDYQSVKKISSILGFTF